MDLATMKLELGKLRSERDEIQKEEQALKMKIGQWDDRFRAFMADTVGLGAGNFHIMDVVEKVAEIRG